MPLFELKNFIMHSGEVGTWKIECDHLSDEDIETFAKIISSKIQFSTVYGVPTGGERLAKVLEKYAKEGGCSLIVDDVLTTGSSMIKARKKLGLSDPVGVVLFSRRQLDPASWIKAVFTLW
jgi:orotate phosphoribosyltransferase